MKSMINHKKEIKVLGWLELRSTIQLSSLTWRSLYHMPLGCSKNMSCCPFKRIFKKWVIV